MQHIIARVKEIILKPRETWETVVAEEATMASLFKNYLLILAAVPALASFLGRWIIGYQVPFMRDVRLSLGNSLISSIFSYALTVGGVWLLGKVISFLGPKFDSVQDDVKGFKVAVYSYTPFLAAGVLYLIPSLSVLVTLAGLYGLYLLYIGLPILMGTPKDKSLPYTIVIIITVIVISIIIGSITAAILGIVYST